MTIQNIHQDNLHHIVAKPGKQVDSICLVGEIDHPIFPPWHFSDDKVAKAERKEYSYDGFNNLNIQSSDRDVQASYCYQKV